MKIGPSYPSEPIRLQPLEDTAPVEDDGGFDLRSIVAFLWRAKWFMVVGMVVGLALAAAFVTSLTPTYTARATVLFSPEDRNIVNIEDVLNTSRADEIVNQIEFLRSTNLLDRVVEQLSLADNPAFNPRLRTETTVWDRVGAWFRPENWLPMDFFINIGLVPPPPPPVELTEEERARLDALGARRILMEALTLAPVPDSRVIRIAVTTGNPALSARVANAVAQQYIRAQLDAKLAANREATLWLNERTEELREEVEAAEAKVSAYRAQLADEVGQSVEAMQQQLSALNAAFAQASARRSAAEIRYQRARQALDDTDRIAALSVFEDARLIGVYRQEELQLRSSRRAAERLVPEGHERLQTLDAQIASAQENIRSEAERVVDVLESELEIAELEEADLEREVRALEDQLQHQEAEEVELRQLESEASASRLLYENFLTRLKETTQQQKLAEADAVVLSPAEPGGPDTASKNRILAVGAFLGIMSGLGLVFLREKLNNTFRSIDQIHEATNLRVLGSIPEVRQVQEPRDVLAYIRDAPFSALAEAVRSLQTSLWFSSIDKPPQLVLFTSTVPQEGKSTTAIVSAITSARMGKKVAVVDCDLRRPSLHAIAGTTGEDAAGLKRVLEGEDLEQALWRDPDTGLAILSVGDSPSLTSNATEILSSARFHAILDRLRGSFDLVILDTPPILSVTDARILSSAADATVYCIRWDHTPREAVLEGLRELSLVNAPVTGVVMTRVDAARASSYGYSAYGSGYYRGSYTDHYHEG